MIKNKGILNLDFSKTVIVKHKRSMVNVFELFYEFDGVCNYNGDDEQGTGATGSILLTESEIETKRCLNFIIRYFGNMIMNNWIFLRISLVKYKRSKGYRIR